MEQEDYTLRMLKFADELNKLIAEERKQLPYHLNIIDELHINENGHSRILFKLLCFQNNKEEYEILESLLSYIIGHTHSKYFGKIHIQKPKITQEEERIDLWVRDEDYAIIFENKACNAQDQDAQICRYIEKTKNHNYKDEQIFVIYLPSTEDKEPSDQSWGNYKSAFADRYVNLSFKDDIIRWLECDVIPNVRQKDGILLYAIMQYLDYLKGLFSLRIIDMKINMKQEELVADFIKLNNAQTENEKLSLINNEIEKLNQVINVMNTLQNQIRDQIYANWRKEIATDYKDIYDAYNELKINQYTHIVGVAPTLYGKQVVIRLYIYPSNNNIYCEIGRDEDGDLDNRIINALQSILILPKDNKTHMFKAGTLDKASEIFECFKQVISVCLSLL